MNATRWFARLSVITLATPVLSCGGLDASNSQASHTASATPVVRVEGLQQRRVWTGSSEDFYASSPSPDGRYMTDIDWDTGDLAVVDLETGQLRRVTNKGPWAKSGSYSEFSVFSADGQRIAYSWFSDESDGYEVRTIKPDGSDMRIVFPARKDVAYAAVEDWSRDGSAIAVTVGRRDRTVQIGTVSPADGTYRALKTNDWRHPTVAVFSPDGKYIAYDISESATRRDRDLFLLADDGSREVQLTKGPGDNALVGWLPDGRGVLYRSSHPESRGLWAIGIESGRPAGAAQLVRADIGQMTPLGFSRDALFYGVRVEQPQPHVVSVDLANGRVLSEPTPLADPTEGAGHDVAWSPDGQMIAYLRDAPATLVIRSVTGELRRETPVPLIQARKTRWTHDGTAVLVFGKGAEGRIGIHRADLLTGTMKPVLTYGPTGEADGMAFWALSADGNTIYHRAPKRRIVAHDLRTGATRDFLQVPPGRAISLSPDGKWLAYTTENLDTRDWGVMVAPTAGGAPREVYHQRLGRSMGNRGSIEWAPDARSILFHHAPAEGPGGIWQVALDGGSPRLLLDNRHLTPLLQGEPGLPWDFRLSPDGRRLAYQAGRDRGEIWMMTGLSTK